MYPSFLPSKKLLFAIKYISPILFLIVTILLWRQHSFLFFIVVSLGAIGLWGIFHFLGLRFSRAQREIDLLTEQYIQSQKMAALGEISSGIAHEINNPLAVIRQETDWVNHLLSRMETESNTNAADLKESIRQIQLHVDRCKEITHKLLDFARKKDPIYQGINVNELAEDMVLLVEKQARILGIEIRRNYSPELPLVVTDPPLLRQVILNLLNNSVQAVDQGGWVQISTLIVDEYAFEIRIEDNGCGIPPENLDRIFNPFFTTKPPGKGTGLGLSLCLSIITRLGGGISVQSPPGKGAKFIVRLPISQGRKDHA